MVQGCNFGDRDFGVFFAKTLLVLVELSPSPPCCVSFKGFSIILKFGGANKKSLCILGYESCITFTGHLKPHQP